MACGRSGLPVQKHAAKVLKSPCVIEQTHHWVTMGNHAGAQLWKETRNLRPCPGVLEEKDGYKFVMQTLFKIRKTLF